MRPRDEGDPDRERDEGQREDDAADQPRVVERPVGRNAEGSERGERRDERTRDGGTAYSLRRGEQGRDARGRGGDHSVGPPREETNAADPVETRSPRAVTRGF
ncbi:hypothetical protein BRD03_00565 [Halobacteriales archaeon QS_9_68_17]|nr:MAG: hypothetical protein BRD03_00565 [Halobacteriales archaeon QS_9_68_17]